MKIYFTLFVVLAFSIAARAKTVTVAATDYVFTPSSITIQVGDVVDWTFNGTHDVTSGTSCTSDGKFSSGTKNTGDTYSFTFSSAGSFPYYCSFHCSVGMVGNITVTSNSGIELADIMISPLKIFPNPFAGGTNISYELKSSALINLTVIDMTGKKIVEINKGLTQGTYTEPLNLNTAPSGIYILEMILNGIPSKDQLIVKR